MKSPLKKLQPEPLYISDIMNETENSILSRYNTFRKLSKTLAVSFNKDIAAYGSLMSVPEYIQKKYTRLFSELFEEYNNLRNELVEELNKNTELLDSIIQNEGGVSLRYKIMLRKHEILKHRLDYYDTVYLLQFF